LITDNVNALIFGLVARDIPEKGWVEAIQAFENIQTKYPEKEIYLLLMGGGKFIDELKHKYFYNKHIIFTGLLKKPIEWISIIDVGLMPSYFMGESLPNAIIEYLYCGKAVITTDIGDTHQMIDSEKGKAGIVVPLNMPHSPAIKHLSEAMLQYVINKGLLIEHQGRAKNAFQKFSMSTCVQKYQSLYDSIVKEK
jgi:glycosyltransferase involved in cell wall biosynthesis